MPDNILPFGDGDPEHITDRRSTARDNEHQWTRTRLPNTVNDPGETVVFCVVCGLENGGSGVIMPPCPPDDDVNESAVNLPAYEG